MTATIVAISDTHCTEWQEVHPQIREAVSQADVAIHCGDYTRIGVLEGMRRAAKKLIAVHGNSDPVEVRQALPYVEVLELEGKRIGVIHPAWGGPPFETSELLQDFAQPPDAVVFGHLHETVNEISHGVLFLNPGQAYSSFMVPATIATLTLEDGGMRAEICVIEKGR